MSERTFFGFLDVYLAKSIWKIPLVKNMIISTDISIIVDIPDKLEEGHKLE